jgi:hypothetical protein
MIEPAYRELFSENVTIYSASAMDAYGKYSYAGSVSVPAHLVAETKLTVSTDGREVVETGKVYLYGQVIVDTDSKIVFADGSSPVIIGVDTPYDNAGWHHTVVSVGV